MIYIGLWRLQIGQKTQNPRPIMIKLTSVMDKETVIQKSREIPYNNRPRLTEDFPPELRDTRTKLISFLIKAKNDGKKASLLDYYWPVTLMQEQVLV